MGKFLWKFYANCGRQGKLEGLFVATKEEIKNIIGSYAYFGEVLGKHSEICGNIEKHEIKKVNLDSKIVEEVSKILGDTWSGFNPIKYIRHTCSICEDKFCLEEFNKEKNICIYCEEENKI
jgi:hypothetical protein